MTDYFTATAARIETAAPEILRAPLFGTLMERVRAEGRRVILDLGPARAGTVDLCNHFHCRLDIADLSTGLDELNTQEDPGSLKEQVESMLPDQGPEATDVVLCWDILNYLQRPALTAVMNGVMSRARAGTLVHALIVYSSSRMPARPGVYSPFVPDDIDDGVIDQMYVTPSTREVCDAPQYTPDMLKRCMYGYHIDRAVLLSNGVQEFLFRIS